MDAVILHTARDCARPAAEIIDAINTLRLSYGLPTLAVHPVLMTLAQRQADGIAASLHGHWRPCGLTLGQLLIMEGYLLAGDLTQDGYRSENWITSMTAQSAIDAWLEDDEHSNTMLSEFRSDIGLLDSSSGFDFEQENNRNTSRQSKKRLRIL